MTKQIREFWILMLSAATAGCAGIDGPADQTTSDELAQTSSSWSALVQPPAGCGSFPGGAQPTFLALNGAGMLALAGYTQVGTVFQVQACTSNDGVSWSGPSTIGQGVAPAVAVAPDGRVVAIWQWSSGVMTNIQSSVRSPSGVWSAPVVVSPNAGHPVIGMDALGNAIAAWAPLALTQPVETASLPVGGNWTAVRTVAAQGGEVNIAVNAGGQAVVTWRSGSQIEVASGTIKGGFGAPAVLGPSYAGVSVSAAPRVALNDAGAASVAWNNHDHNVVSSRNPDGTWSALTALSDHSAGIRIAIDGAGNALAAFSQTLTSGNPTYASLRPAGGTWGAPTLLSSLTDTGPGVAEAVGDANGTFIVTWTSGTGAVEALTIPPGGGFGPSTAVGNGPSMSLKIVPGHAALWMGGGLTTEPVN